YSTRLDLINILDRFPDLRSHSDQNAEQSGASVIQTNMPDEQMSAGLGGSSDQPKSGRRDIAGNIEIARFGHLIAKYTNPAIVVFGCANQKIIKHQLGVITTGRA